MTYDTAELKRLMEAGQFTKPLFIDYAELGLDDNTRLVAFLMHGDPDDGEYVCVDEDPSGLDVPSPRLEAIAAAVNALPALLARVEELEGALGVYNTCADDCIHKAMFSSKQDVVNHIMAAQNRARAALKGGA